MGFPVCFWDRPGLVRIVHSGPGREEAPQHSVVFGETPIVPETGDTGALVSASLLRRALGGQAQRITKGGIILAWRFRGRRHPGCSSYQADGCLPHRGCSSLRVVVLSTGLLSSVPQNCHGARSIVQEWIVVKQKVTQYVVLSEKISLFLSLVGES